MKTAVIGYPRIGTSRERAIPAFRLVHRVPSVGEIKDALCRMLEKLPQKKLWVNPDCGLKTRGEAETVLSLENLVTAAKDIRKSLQL